MSLIIQKMLTSIADLKTPSRLTFDKFYTDTLNRPNGYDEFNPAFKHLPYQYAELYDTSAKYKLKGGQSCCVCMEDKPVRSMLFCRVCSNGLCSGCYQGCRRAGGTFEAITAIDDMTMDQHQPPCPTCRGEGTFGNKGIKATRVITFAGTDNGITYTYGPNIFADKKLKAKVHKYIKGYNKMCDIIQEKIDTDKVILTDNLRAIETDDIYNDIGNEINSFEQQIRDLEQTIREFRSAIYDLRFKREQHVKDNIIGPSPIDVEWLKANLNLDMSWNTHNIPTLPKLVESLTKNYPRVMKRQQLYGNDKNDLDYNRGLRFGLHATGRMKGGFNGELDDTISKITQRVNLLGAGAVMVEREEDADKLTDGELEEQMKMLQAIMEKRKGGGGAK